MNNSQCNQLLIKAITQLKITPVNIKYEYDRYGNIWAISCECYENISSNIKIPYCQITIERQLNTKAKIKIERI